MTTIIPERLAAFNNGLIRLDSSSHDSFEDGHCAMEAVAWLAGEGHTDAPECASRVLRTFTISLNDTWGDADRQRLVPFLPRMVGTANDGKDEARSYLALDWLIRTYAPAFLDLANLTEEARALRDLRRIVDMASAEAAVLVVRAGRVKAAAAGAAAGDAAWAAARNAALAAAQTTAGADARDAAMAALTPTVETLKTSALELLDAMINPSTSTKDEPKQ
ncbi:hypothetical protein ANMWB30_24740 [Arthrobacter sp. MWB30]|nr:hypothetical protein ANMWB30_24740 [Arthrobacter sp. MWB30]